MKTRVPCLVIVLTTCLLAGHSQRTATFADEKKKAYEVPKGGLKLEGTLTQKDPKVDVEFKGEKGKLPSKIYEVKLTGKAKYIIEVIAEDQKKLDPFLLVQDKDFKQLAADDDGGEGFNSRLEFTAPANGIFHIYAASLRGEGKYTLKITPQK